MTRPPSGSGKARLEGHASEESQERARRVTERTGEEYQKVKERVTDSLEQKLFLTYYDLSLRIDFKLRHGRRRTEKKEIKTLSMNFSTLKTK